MGLRASVLCVVAMAACSKGGAGAPPGTRALVNGRPIAAIEVQQHLAPGATPAQERAAVDELVREELLAQRAVELGLADPKAAEPADPQGRYVRRRALAKQFRLKELFEKTTVTDDEVRAAFDAHPSRVQSEVQLSKLEFPSVAAAEAARTALTHGQSFEQVASAQLPAPAPGERPWDLPPLPFERLPPSWWDPVDALQVGQLSPVIAQPDHRFVVLELVARRARDPQVTFEQARPALQAALRSARFEARASEVEQQLLAKAKVELLAAP